MKCLNCPNDETFFKSDGLKDSHLCGICGAFITNQSADENYHQLLIEEHSNSQANIQKSETIANVSNETFLTENESCSSSSLQLLNDKKLEPLKGNYLATLSDAHANGNEVSVFTNSDLHLDYKLLQEKYAALWDDFRGLEATLEELMVAYEAQIEVTQKLQSDHRASDELREMEASRLRIAFREEQSRVEVLEAENSKLSLLCTKLKTDMEMLRSENEHIRSDFSEIEEKFNQLKQQAERKLKLAEEKVKVTISSYASLQEKFSSLENEYLSLSSRNESCSSELSEKESRCDELTQNVASLLDVLKEKEQEIASSESFIANNQLELQVCKQKLHDMQELNCRFKAGLVRANEDNRALKEKLSRLELLENENQENRSRLDSLTNENSNLKSRIFDAMETEKALRQALSCSNYAQSEDSSILDELESLKKDLQEKTIENKELLQISKELLDKLECTASNVSHVHEEREL